MPTKVKHGRRELGTEAEQAAELGVKPNTLKMARCSGVGPFAQLRWFKLSHNVVRYDLTYTREIWLPRHARGGMPDAA